ncbi:hypothetical protein BGX26_001006 [Mortierella sp. AD094]|nr:hypothetical protein BGX26_001006 [Mortierella sp. AD094]
MSSNPSPSASPSSNSPSGVAIGGGVAAAVVLITVAVGFIYYRNRRSSQHRRADSKRESNLTSVDPRDPQVIFKHKNPEDDVEIAPSVDPPPVEPTRRSILNPTFGGQFERRVNNPHFIIDSTNSRDINVVLSESIGGDLSSSASIPTETGPQDFAMSSQEKDQYIVEDMGVNAPRQSVDEEELEKVFSDRRFHEAYPQTLVLPRILTKSAWKLMIVTTIIAVCFIWLYVGSVWSPNTRIHNVNILLYNDDAGFDYSNTLPEIAQELRSLTNNSSLGDYVQNAIMNPQTSINRAFLWTFEPPRLDWTRDSVVDYVEKGHAWGAIYIPSNFSNNLLTFAPSISTGPATDDSLKLSSPEYI